MGLHQKIRQCVSIANSNIKRPIALVTKLVQKWAWCIMSTPQVQELAAAELEDLEALGVKPPKELSMVASIGSDGRYKNTMHRDLLTKLKAVSYTHLTLPTKA